jgi:hypothetical protein
MADNGIDTTDRTLTGKTLKAAGFEFACRYVLNAPGPNHIDKQMTAAEVREKSAAGIRIVSNFEWDPIPRNTVAEGKAHARAFLDAHSDLRGPDWAPCYYSVDTPAGAGSFDNYARGWADILGPERCGCYGDGSLFRALKKAGLITLAWQSLSTSFPGNNNHTGANLVQTSSGHVAGHAVDFNSAKSAYYGGWLLGEANPNPPKGSDVELTDKLSNGQTVDQALSLIVKLPTSIWHTDQFTPKLDANGKPVVPTVYTESGSARMDRLDKLQAYIMSPQFIDDILAAIPAGGGASPDAIAAAVTEVINRTVLNVAAP